jgi:hypothetical protein
VNISISTSAIAVTFCTKRCTALFDSTNVEVLSRFASYFARNRNSGATSQYGLALQEPDQFSTPQYYTLVSTLAWECRLKSYPSSRVKFLEFRYRIAERPTIATLAPPAWAPLQHYHSRIVTGIGLSSSESAGSALFFISLQDRARTTPTNKKPFMIEVWASFSHTFLLLFSPLPPRQALDSNPFNHHTQDCFRSH